MKNVVSYLQEKVIEAIKNEEFGSYWTRTETYESLKIYIELDEDGLKEAIIQMLGGAHFKIKVGSFQNDMTTIKVKDDVLTLLVHLGYLAYDAGEEAVFISNEEVRQEFLLAVTTGKHTEVARMIRNLDYLLEQTLNMNEEAVAEAIGEAHSMGTAPVFYNNEQALQDYSGDILLVGINYNEGTKKHTCKIEKHKKQS